MSKQLVIINDDFTVEHQGSFELQINVPKKFLLIHSQNEEYKPFSVNFDNSFIPQKHILCVFDKFYKFALIFGDEKQCGKVYNIIAKYNNNNSQSPLGEANQIFCERFLDPVCNTISKQTKSMVFLKQILMDLRNSYEGEDKEKFMDFMKQRNIDTIIPENVKIESFEIGEMEDEQSSVVGTDFVSSNNLKFEAIVEKENLDITESPPKVWNLRKRPAIRISPESDFEIDKCSNSSENSDDSEVNQKTAKFYSNKLSKTKPLVKKRCREMKVLKNANFQVINYLENGKPKNRLIVFTSEEKKLCYEFYFSNNDNRYMCCECFLRANVKKRNGGKEYIEVFNRSHTCKPRPYLAEKFQKSIIKKPNFLLLEESKTNNKARKMLIIFNLNEDERNLCYEYFWSESNQVYYCSGCSTKKKLFNARVLKNDENVEYVELQNGEHICEMRKYEPEKFTQEKRIVRPPNFEIHKDIKFGVERKTLLVFANEDKNLCYNYYYYNQHDSYVCSKCSKKSVNVEAKLFENENGEYLQLGANDHVCDPKSVEAFVITPETHFEANMYEVMPNANNCPKLFIFTTADKKMCYTFSSTAKNEFYDCLGCLRKEGKIIKAKLCSRESGESFIIVRGEHVCTSQIYSPEKYENKIIKSPNFFYFRDKNQPEILKAIVFDKNDKFLCYEFQYRRNENHIKKGLYCLGCNKIRRSTKATIFIDDDGQEYLELGWKGHGCKPLKYSSIDCENIEKLESSGFEIESKKGRKVDESKILKSCNFVFQCNKAGVPNKKLVIYHPTDKNLCYDYFYLKQSHRFMCTRCKDLGVSVSAKLSSNPKDGEYLELGRRRHICEPKIYVPEKIIKQPDFKIIDDEKENKPTKLMVFTSAEHKQYYQYSYLKTANNYICQTCRHKNVSVHANVFENSNGEKYVRFGKTEHVCSPKDYNPAEHEKIIIEPSNFELVHNLNGAPNTHLLVFDSENRYLAHEYFECRGNYYCMKCTRNKSNANAKIFTNKNGSKYLELGSNKHQCEMENLLKNERISKPQTFQIIENLENGGKKLLKVKNAKNKNTFYIFDFVDEYQGFCCQECREKGKLIIAKICKNISNEEYLIFNAKHCCKPHSK